MSLIPFKGDPAKGGLPRGTSIRIEALPDRTVVFVGQVSGTAYLDLDPGKYVYSAVRISGSGSFRKMDDVSYRGEFYHEVDEASWAELRHLHPQMCSILTTNEGCRWVCRIYNCGNRATTATAALIHEVVDHIGIPREEFLKAPQEVGRKAARGYQTMSAQVAPIASRPNAEIPVVQSAARNEAETIYTPGQF